MGNQDKSALLSQNEKLQEVQGESSEQELYTEMFVTVVKQRPEDKVGMGLTKCAGELLVVNAVKTGLIQDWNSASKDGQVMTGDLLYQVNGVEGDADKLLQRLKEGVKLE